MVDVPTATVRVLGLSSAYSLCCKTGGLQSALSIPGAGLADYTGEMSTRQTGASRSHQEQPRRDSPSRSLILWALAFALAYGQSPLFTSNQNQYFLHGLARAGYGQLAHDWLANTLDPTPLFSGLVWLVAETLPLAVFYLMYGVLLGLYFISLWLILDGLFDLRSSKLRLHGSALLLLGLHSALLRFLLGRALGAEASFLIEGGLAGQRLLGTVFQPSTFGVLLLAAIALFLVHRPYAAIVAAVAACSFHPTYLLSAAALTGSFMWLSWRQDGQLRRPLLLGGLALLLVLPILVYSLQLFQGGSASDWNLAANLLVTERIPHHALPAEWFSWTTIFKLALILIGLDLSIRTRLGRIMLLPIGLALALTLVQLLSGSHRLALLFPWRLSTWLVPICASLLALYLADKGLAALKGRLIAGGNWARWLLWLAAVGLATAGLVRTLTLIRQQQAEPAQALFSQVRQQLEPGQIYLIPPGLQDFRLETGAPAFVDFKAIPYQAGELLAWQERLRLAQFFYRDDPSLISCNLLARIQRMGDISHVILESDQFGLECPGLKPLYADEAFALFRYQPD